MYDLFTMFLFVNLFLVSCIAIDLINNVSVQNNGAVGFSPTSYC